MPEIKINNTLLDLVCTVNQFSLARTGLVFIGVRGAITPLPSDNSFTHEQLLSVMDINYCNPRCTILQWNPTNSTIAAFPASTVPHISNIRSAVSKNGEGANCLMTGYYKDYRKGFHKADSPTGHEAFRQNATHPIRRTADDMDFDTDDRIEYDNPQDNLHCGWFDGLDSNTFASAGCQVVMGFPKCDKPGRTSNIGPWKVFRENAYSAPQDSFPYILVTGMELNSLANNPNPQAKLRFGSSGKLVENLQTALKQKRFYEGKVDGDFGERTMRAVTDFQRSAFGNKTVDGIVGPVTAEALGIALALNGN
jgi:hypothetical protein